MGQSAEETFSNDDYGELAVPVADSFVESFRSTGYTLSVSIADLLDTSIFAGAKNIAINFVWGGPDSFATVLDDGGGMPEESLVKAMALGSTSPNEERDPKDLGRFGLGLKSASWAHARSLTVITRNVPREAPFLRRWDLDAIKETKEWRLLKKATETAKKQIKLLGSTNPGTLIVWEKLDRIVDERGKNDTAAEASFLENIDSVKEHLEMVFHRFLENGLSITVNGQLCEPWDPFMESHAHTEPQPDEDMAIPIGGGNTAMMLIRPYLLPHVSKRTPEDTKSGAGIRGWNQQQGFYLYRAERLIIAGDWFNKNQKQEEHFKLARVKVEIPQDSDLDKAWTLDLKKSSARPPIALRDEFERIAAAARTASRTTFNTLGRSRRSSRNESDETVPVWMLSDRDGQTRWLINRQHRFAKTLLEATSGEQKRDFQALFLLLEKSIPLLQIISKGGSSQGFDRFPSSTEEPTPEMVNLAKRIFTDICQTESPEWAKSVMISQEPFNQFPEIIEAFEKEN